MLGIPTQTSLLLAAFCSLFPSDFWEYLTPRVAQMVICICGGGEGVGEGRGGGVVDGVVLSRF